MLMISIEKVKYLSGYKLEIVFNTHEKKVVDLKSRLHGEVFSPLKDINSFKNFHIDGYTIAWDNGADLAPEYLYSIGKSI